MTPLLLLSKQTRAPLLFQDLTPPARSVDPRPTTSLTPPFYTLRILSPPVLVSDPSKSGATTTVATAINKPEIEVKEADEDDDRGSVNFMVYAGAVFDRILIIGGDTVLFMESMTKMERRKGTKQGA